MDMKRVPSCKSASRFIASVAVLLSMAPVYGQSPQTATLLPGYWEVATTPQFQGVPFIPSTKTDRFCLSAEDVEAGKIPLRTSPDCNISGGERKEGRLVLKLECAAEPHPATSAHLDEAGKSLSGSAEIKLLNAQGEALGPRFIYRYVGKRLGAECPAAKP